MRKGKFKLKRWRDCSIVFKLFFSVTLCMVFLFGFNWLLNNMVLENYYRDEKQKGLVSIYTQVDGIMEEDLPLSVWQLEMDRINSAGNYRTVLYTPWNFIMQGSPLYSSAAGISIDGTESITIFVGDPTSLEAGSYKVDIVTDPRLGQNYIALTGVLHNGMYLFVNTPLEAIRESVDISNRFLLFTGILTLLLSGVIIFRIARGFAKPVRELSEQTKRIAKLDFSQKYEVKSQDEIGRLMENVNQLSSELEKNISSLKTANTQLKRDNLIKTQQVETRREFIANASHELKTPIALIMAYAEGLLEDVTVDEESRKYYCEVIRDEAEKMSQLIKKMTSLMQLESGEEELSITRFELTEVISDVLKRYSIFLEERRIAVDYFADGEYYVWGDAFFIENVLNNYISNAANHVSEKGEIRVTLELTDCGEQKHVRVTVFNTGEQLPAEELNKIWESFYKVDKARTRAYGGTGIGLSVVAAIMRAHNMPFGVKNEKDGVSFWFELET